MTDNNLFICETTPKDAQVICVHQEPNTPIKKDKIYTIRKIFNKEDCLTISLRELHPGWKFQSKSFHLI